MFGYAGITGVAHPCDQSVCRHVVDTKGLWVLNYPTGSDMPVVRRSPLGLTVFYRFDTGAGGHGLRVAQIDTDGFVFGAYPSFSPGSIHRDVTNNDFPFIYYLDYYAVSEGNANPDIVLYEVDPASGLAGGDRFAVLRFVGDATFSDWEVYYSTWRIAGVVSNPGFSSGYNAALRNTVVYLP